MALAGAFPWGRAALLPSCYFVSCTVDYTNYGSMNIMAMFRRLTSEELSVRQGIVI
jgi:hypothetical protein